MAIGTGISALSVTPYLQIINCCDTDDRGLFNVSDLNFTSFQNGVYSYTGPTLATTQMTFVPGNCYRITYPGNSATTYTPLTLSQFSNFDLSSTDIETGCAGCIDCNPSLTKLVFTNCCDNSVIETQGALPFGITQWIVKFPIPINNFENACYTVTQVNDVDPQQHAGLPPAPVNSTYTIVSTNSSKTCADFPVPECPSCQDPQCYTVINCDGVYFNTWEDLSAYEGQFIEIDGQNGSWFVVKNNGVCSQAVVSIDVVGLAPECPCICYEITLNTSQSAITELKYVNCDNELIVNSSATKFCSRVKPLVKGKGFNIVIGDLCENGLCPEQCFKLTNCDTSEEIYSTLQSLSQYVNNGVVSLLGYDGCWIVEPSVANCDCLTVTIETRDGVTEYTANAFTTYDGNIVYQYSIGTDVYYIWFATDTGWLITIGGYGLSDPFFPVVVTLKSLDPCPEAITNTGSTGWVFGDASEGIINLETEVCPVECNCPVDVTVLQRYEECIDCIPYVAYKLQNCRNSFEVQYTTQDLSEYVGEVIETDCACWKVIQINYIPPSTTLVTIDFSFKNCNDCLSKFYRLTDCEGIVDDIVTKTNLQAYLGKIVKIENCENCWEVTETRTFTELSNVVVLQDFETCEDCGIPTVCECTKITNLNEVEKTYNYYDCDNILQSITLQPGESSDKVCALYWIATPLFCSCIQFKLKGQSYYAFIVPDQFFNGKPFYTLCTFGDITECGYVYWDGTDWVIADSDDNITWILSNPTSESCPYGDWAEYNQEVGPRPLEDNPRTKASVDVQLTSEQCDLDICTCITLTLDSGGSSTFYVVAIDTFGNPIYSDGLFTIEFQAKSNCWVYGLGDFRDPYYLCDLNLQCPIGNWESESGSSFAVSVECPPVSNEFTVFDHFETYGECKFGNCPQPVFKNNRTVRPGYNTPICTPEKYDEITCRFADIMYKVVLEKRYGITNCCPDEDDKWLIKKELIDLQALKDPNYNCPECSCGCNTQNTCNCKN